MNTFEMFAELGKDHNEKFIGNKGGNEIVCEIEDGLIKCTFMDSLSMTSLAIDHDWERLKK